MKVEHYVLEILKKIEDKGYDAYIAGTAVLLHSLKKPIKEYDIITSAPLFFLMEGKIKDNALEITLFPKKITIYFKTTLEDYKKQTRFIVETLFYHPRHGIIGSKEGLIDLDNHIIRSAKKLSLEDLFVALSYKYILNFKLDSKIEKLLQLPRGSMKKECLILFFRTFFLLDCPSKLFSKYSCLFKDSCNLEWILSIDYLKVDFNLRFTLFLCYQKDAIEWLKVLKLPKDLEEKMLSCTKYFNQSLSLEELFELNIASLWFPVKKAIALTNKDFQGIRLLEQITEEYEKFSKTKRVLNITLEELMEIGFTKEEAKKVLDFLKREVKYKAISSSKEDLLTKAFKIYEEKRNSDAFLEYLE